MTKEEKIDLSHHLPSYDSYSHNIAVDCDCSWVVTTLITLCYRDVLQPAQMTWKVDAWWFEKEVDTHAFIK